MTNVVFVFQDEDGEDVRVECTRMRIPAHEVESDDHYADGYMMGFVHVHDVRRQGGWAVFIDCHDNEHYLPAATWVEVARPVNEREGEVE